MGDHQDLWIEINENRLLSFRKHFIIPSTARNLCEKIFIDTIHKSLVKHNIYQKIHYVNVRAIYPLPLHLARVFKILYELLTRLIHAADKSAEENNRLCEMVTRIKENY